MYKLTNVALILEKEHILKFQMDITAKVDEIKQKYLFNNVRDDTMCIIDTCTYEINLLNEQYVNIEIE